MRIKRYIGYGDCLEERLDGKVRLSGQLSYDNLCDYGSETFLLGIFQLYSPFNKSLCERILFLRDRLNAIFPECLIGTIIDYLLG